MDSKKILIQLNNVTFKYPSQDYIFEDLKVTIMEGDTIAIVGANGSGKSTLLKLLTGHLKPEDGTQEINCKPYYVPQIDLTIQQQDLKIYEYVTEFYDEWWDVLSDCERMFDLHIDTDLEAKTLSGGELMKVNLAIALRHNPDVLILDEPTNHLDIKSINSLIEFIRTTGRKYTYIIVSHDTFFLDSVVSEILELEEKKITAYGGNYTFYMEQKKLHLRGIRKQYELAKDKLEKTQELVQRDIEKQAKKASKAKLAFIKGSINKRQYGTGKDAASSLQHGKSVMIDRLQDEVSDKLEEFETEERRLAFMNIKNTKDNANKTIFELKEASVKVGSAELIKGINLKIVYGDRVVIAGDNGSGKTSLIKALIKKVKSTHKIINSDNVELIGDIYRGDDLSWVYIDQHYSLVNPELTLIDNLLASHPSITEDKAKEQLGKFQFKADLDASKKGRDLSGGELVRLVMAMITAFPIDLLILDEPTNNLDVETVAVLVKSLNNFRGAIIVISHNIDFLNKINIQTAYIIKNKKLLPLNVSPSQKDAFYKALLG